MNKRRPIYIYYASLLFFLLLQGFVKAQGAADIVKYSGIDYYVYEVDIKKANLQIHQAKDFKSVEIQYEQAGKEMTFGMNGGIYHANKNPVGLLVVGGQECFPLNTQNGKGNFYLKPNGVFYFSENSAGVVPTEHYEKLQEEVIYATQSGPMLLSNGELHPDFNAQSANKFIRNGVGAISATKLVFAMSTQAVNFHTFASFFKKIYNCNNALYLDGTVSQFYAPSLGLNQNSKTEYAVLIADSKAKGTATENEVIANNNEKQLEVLAEKKPFAEKSNLAQSITLKNAYIPAGSSKSYRLCIVDLKQHQIDFFMPKKSIKGKAFYMKKKVPKYQHWKVYMLGVESPMGTHQPVGLYIENGKEQRALQVLSKGTGNIFSYKENGVFFIDQQRNIGIIESKEFDAKNILHAVQAGPFLVKDGQVNPELKNNSQNFRSGIGYINKHTLVFIKSNEPVGFQELAAAMQSLKCHNALYCQTGKNAVLNDRWQQLGKEEDPLQSKEGYSAEAKIPFLFVVY